MLGKLIDNLFPNRIEQLREQRQREKTEEALQWEQRWRDEFPEKRRNVPIDLMVDWVEYRKAQLELGFGEPKPEELLSRQELDWLHGQEHHTVHLQMPAEVCCGNWVVEILPQLVSGEEFRAKNWFYTRAGYRVIWILNFLGTKDPDWEATDEAGIHFRWKWKNPHEMMEGFLPQNHEDIRVYFQYTEPGADADIMDRIIWVKEGTNDTGETYTDYHSFITAEDEVQDAETLKKLIGCEQCKPQDIIWAKND